MDPILQVMLSSHIVLIFLALLATFLMAVILKKIKRHPNILLGISGLIQSPSGVFGFLTLAAITFVTYKQPSVGGMAFAAFVGVVPAILAFCEHKETLAGICQVAPLTTTVTPLTTTTTTTTMPPTVNLPSRGTL